jgi:hypothetical protein
MTINLPRNYPDLFDRHGSTATAMHRKKTVVNHFSLPFKDE